MATRPHVVIVGGGFGGVEAAKSLSSADVDITLLDRRNHHLFQPLLYQVATAGLNPADISAPIRAILRHQDNVTVLMSEVAAVDPEARLVELSDETTLTYDYLILAAGTRHSYFGNDQWEQHAPGLKSVEDAIEIRRRVLLAFERAEASHSDEDRQAELTFVVVGGGPTGVEMAGAIAEIAFRTVARDFRRIDPETARVILVEGADRVLGAYPASLSRKALRQLERLGVEVRTETMVEDITADTVETNGGTIRSKTVVWGAGNAGSPIGATMGVELDRAGRIVVDSDLSVPGYPDLFVVGDLAAAESKGKPVPGVAQGALQGGRHAAQAIRADLSDKPRSPFRYRNKGELATIGRSSAVGVIGRFRLSGWIAWMAWWLVHIFFLINFRSRAIVLFSWSWSYLTFQRGARLITRAWRADTQTTDSDTDEG